MPNYVKLFATVFLITLVVAITGCASSAISTRAVMLKEKRAIAVKRGMVAVDMQEDFLPLNLPLNEQASSKSSSTKNGIKISVITGFDGFSKSGDWMPVFVTVENKGAPVKGLVEISPSFVKANQSFVKISPRSMGMASSAYQQDVDLGSRDKKRLLFNIQPYAADNAPIVASFVSNGRDMVSTTAQPAVLPPNAQIVIAVTENNANQQFFKDLIADDPSTKVSYMGIEELPYRDASLATVSSIVISGASTSSLTGEQKSALSNWVASGGRLIICGGSNWKKTISGLPEKLMPVIPSGIKTMDNLTPIAEFADVSASDIAYSGSVVATSVSKVNGQIEAGDTNNPLIVYKNIGSGTVVWVALDVTMEPFTSWRINPKFWSHLSQTQQTTTNNIGYSKFDVFMNMQNALSSIPALKLPSMQWLLPYMLLYIIVIGPVNYYILKRKDRREYAWLTIPAIIIFFSFGSFIYAYGKKGGSILINQINIVEQFPGTNVAKISNSFGVFSPGKQSYNILLPAGSSAYELTLPGPMAVSESDNNTLVIEDGLRPKIKDMKVGMWSMRSIHTERFTDFSPGLSGKVTVNDGGISVLISNKNKQEYHDTAIIVGKNFWQVGKIPASGERKFSGNSKVDLSFDPRGEPIGNRIYGSSWRAGERDVSDMAKAEIINSFLGPQGEKISKDPVLVVWQDSPVEEVKVMGEHPKTSGKTVLLVPLKYEFANTFTLPVGTLNRRIMVSDMVSDARYNAKMPDQMIFLNNNSATFEYSLPHIEKAYKAVKLNLYFSGFQNTPDISADKTCTAAIYNWKSNNWYDLGAISDIKSIENPENFISKDGKIRARISTTSQEVNVDTFDFEVTGKCL